MSKIKLKEQVLITVPAKLSVGVKILAAIMDTNVSVLTEEAHKLLIEKYSELLEKRVRFEEVQEYKEIQLAR